MIGKSNSEKFGEDKYSKILWSSGTDEEIVAMVAAADAGKINLDDYWSIGDTRVISLGAMSSGTVGETQYAQDAEFTLMDTTCTGFTITETGKKPSFIVGMKNCLRTEGYMNRRNTNSGGWNGCARRTWCNEIFYNAIPSTLKPIFKQFTWTISGTSNDDYFALPPEKAVTDNSSYSGGSGYNQWEWYQSNYHRVKLIDSVSTSYNVSSNSWYFSSAYNRDNASFCYIRNEGYSYYTYASNVSGISPFGCI